MGMSAVYSQKRCGMHSREARISRDRCDEAVSFFLEADGARSFSRFSERCPSQLGVDCNSESAPQLLSRIRVLEPGEEASRAMEVVQSKAKPPEDTISTAQLPAAWAI